MTTRRSTLLTVVAYAALVASFSGLAGVLYRNGIDASYIIIVVAGHAGFGLVANRWWTSLLPLGPAALAIPIGHVDGQAWALIAGIFSLPGTAGVVIGVSVRRLLRRPRVNGD